MLRCPWMNEAVDPWRERWLRSCRALFVCLCRDGEAAGCLGGQEGALAPSEPRSLSPARSLILSRRRKLGKSLKCRSTALQYQTSQQPLAAEGRDTAGVWITSFYPQNELEQVHKLQNKIIKTVGNYSRDLWSPPQHREPQRGCQWPLLLLILSGKY